MITYRLHVGRNTELDTLRQALEQAGFDQSALHGLLNRMLEKGV
jgi:hypothetical protein